MLERLAGVEELFRTVPWVRWIAVRVRQSTQNGPSVAEPPLHGSPQSLRRPTKCRLLLECKIRKAAPRTGNAIHVRVVVDVDLSHDETATPAGKPLSPVEIRQDQARITVRGCEKSGIAERWTERLRRNMAANS